MNKKSIWKVKLNTASLVLIPVAVGINYIGKLIIQTLKLPLWLGSIGTAISSILAGPIIGAISGAVNNIIYGLNDPMSIPYAITSVFIGVSIGILARKNKLSSLPRVIFAGLLVALISAVVSTPLNVALYEGQSGIIWSDGAVLAPLLAKGCPMFIASFLDEFIIDIPDKIITMIIAFGIIKGLPKSLTLLYKDSEEIENLD